MIVKILSYLARKYNLVLVEKDHLDEFEKEVKRMRRKEKIDLSSFGTEKLKRY